MESDEPRPFRLSFCLHQHASAADRDRFLYDVAAGPVAPELVEVDAMGVGRVEYTETFELERQEIQRWLGAHPLVRDYSV